MGGWVGVGVGVGVGRERRPRWQCIKAASVHLAVYLRQLSFTSSFTYSSHSISPSTLSRRRASAVECLNCDRVKTLGGMRAAMSHANMVPLPSRCNLAPHLQRQGWSQITGGAKVSRRRPRNLMHAGNVSNATQVQPESPCPRDKGPLLAGTDRRPRFAHTQARRRRRRRPLRCQVAAAPQQRQQYPAAACMMTTGLPPAGSARRATGGRWPRPGRTRSRRL